MKRMLALAGLFLVLSAGAGFSYWDKKPEYRFQQLLRYDTRHSDHRLFMEIISAGFTLRDSLGEALFKAMPLVELRRNIDTNKTERKSIGLELGKDITPWFYLGQRTQRNWLREDYRTYRLYEKRENTETRARLLFSHDLIALKAFKLKGFALEEYTYDFNRGAAIFNEVSAGIIIPWHKHLESVVAWRHIDGITYYDSDTVEASLTAVF
jgi:hypothetical protein